MSRVHIGHSDNTDDMDYLSGLAEKGAYIGLDGLRVAGNSPGAPEFQQRIDIVAKLIEAGFADRIMLGHDWSVLGERQIGGIVIAIG